VVPSVIKCAPPLLRITALFSVSLIMIVLLGVILLSVERLNVVALFKLKCCDSNLKTFKRWL